MQIERKMALAVLVIAAWSASATAQTFDSGSTGADGAFDLTGTPAGTVVLFDPVARGIDPERDNVFHFTTITIPSGVTVRLSGAKLTGPVYWLATGAVSISGTVDLSGERGHIKTRSTADRRPSIPGPGGYPGGVGGHYEASKGTARPGAGPQGGAAAGPNALGDHLGIGGSNPWQYPSGNSMPVLLVPLFGGSGGGGARANEFEYWAGAGGGAGGGAMLIASSTSITLHGNIWANGGSGGTQSTNCSGASGLGYYGGDGGGGAIRLAAPTIAGGGSLQVSNGGHCWSHAPASAATGRVRIEAFQRSYSFSIPYGTYTIGVPYRSYVPTTPPPSIRVVSVAGIAVPSDPTGSFSAPDVTLNSAAALPIVVEARHVPVGTTPTLVLMSLEGADQTLTMPALMGTTQQSTTTAQVTFPPSFTRGYVRATWQ
jgi:hypothetical protein